MRHAMNSNTFAAVLAPAVLFALVGCGGNPDSTAPRSEVRVGPADSIAGAGVLQRVEQAITKPDRHSEEVTQLAAQIALLRAEVADLRRNLPRTSAAPAPDVARDWRSDPDARDEVQAAERARVVSAEAAFRREDVDARWSQQAVAEVRAGLAEAHPSIRNAVRAVECRAQTCRVEIGSDASELLRQDLVPILGGISRTLPNAVVGQVDEGNGRQALVLFLSH